MYRLLLGDSKRNIFQSSCSIIGDHKKIEQIRDLECVTHQMVFEDMRTKGPRHPNPRGRAVDSGRTAGILPLRRPRSAGSLILSHCSSTG